MSEVRFEQGADEEAINTLSVFIRDLERQDFEANFPSVREGLEMAAKNSDMVVTGYLDDEPVAIFGVGMQGSVGVPWLVLTEEATTHKLKVVRHARAWVEVIQKLYTSLENYVMADDQPAIDLLEVCGFNVDLTKRVKRKGLDYHFFWIGEAA